MLTNPATVAIVVLASASAIALAVMYLPKVSLPVVIAAGLIVVFAMLVRGYVVRVSTRRTPPAPGQNWRNARGMDCHIAQVYTETIDVIIPDGVSLYRRVKMSFEEWKRYVDGNKLFLRHI